MPSRSVGLQLQEHPRCNLKLVSFVEGRERPKKEQATPGWQVAGLNKGTYIGGLSWAAARQTHLHTCHMLKVHTEALTGFSQYHAHGLNTTSLVRPAKCTFQEVFEGPAPGSACGHILLMTSPNMPPLLTSLYNVA